VAARLAGKDFYASIMEHDRENSDAATDPRSASGAIRCGRRSLDRVSSNGRQPSRLSYVQSACGFSIRSVPAKCRQSSLGVRLTGAVEVDSLQRAANAIVARHEILRTVFARNELQAGVNGQPVS